MTVRLEFYESMPRRSPTEFRAYVCINTHTIVEEEAQKRGGRFITKLQRVAIVTAKGVVWRVIVSPFRDVPLADLCDLTLT